MVTDKLVAITVFAGITPNRALSAEESLPILASPDRLQLATRHPLHTQVQDNQGCCSNASPWCTEPGPEAGTSVPCTLSSCNANALQKKSTTPSFHRCRARGRNQPTLHSDVSGCRSSSLACAPGALWVYRTHPHRGVGAGRGASQKKQDPSKLPLKPSMWK